MIEIIKAEFTAGEVKTFLIQGEYLEILEAAYPVDVAMLDRSGAQLSVMRNAEASYFSRPGRYEVIQVTSTLAQTVRIFVGSGDAGTRKTSGDVSVIDGGKARTLANKAFSGAMQIPPVAATFSTAMLWNSLGSGKNCVLESILISVSTTQAVRWGIGTAAEGTLTGVFGSKKSGGPAADLINPYSGNLAGEPIGFSYVGYQLVNAYEPLMIVFREPVVIVPGFGFSVQCVTVNTQLASTFEFFEDVI